MKNCITLNGIILFLLISLNPLLSQTQVGQDIDGEATDDHSGFSVSLSSDGNRIAIGANSNDGNDIDVGHVRVYDLSGDTWTQVGQDIDGEESDDFSGRSISLSKDGNRLAIGADDNDGNGNNSGNVRVYAWNGGNWTQLGSDIDGEVVDGRSGRSVSLSSDSNRLAIGSVGSAFSTGHVQVFEWNGNSWIQIGANIKGAAQEDDFGTSVSLSSDGNLLAVGAPGNKNGHAQIYEWDGISWFQKGANIDGLGDGNGDLFGYSVAFSSDGSRLAVGSPFYNENDNYFGLVRLFEWSGDSWMQMGSSIKGMEDEGLSGISVSLSSDGSRVVIGTPFNIENVANAGVVRIYDWSGGEWIQAGEDIYGESEGDQSGVAVSISSDGSRAAIGAWLNDDNGSNAGHVRIYDLNTTSIITIKETERLEVYPNPTNGKIRLRGVKNGAIRIIDSFGRIILNSEISSGEIDLTELPDGIYYIQYATNNQSIVSKIIKM